MPKNLRIIWFLLLSFLLFCCGKNKTEHLSEVGDTLLLRHAKNLTIVTFPERIDVTMRNPWDTTAILAKYSLVTKQHQTTEKNLPSYKSRERKIIFTPLERAAVFSSVHCALLHELGADTAVGGICDIEFLNLANYREAVKDGRITNLGNSMQPNLERLLNLNPDALLPSPFENSGGLGRAEKLGFPIIWCADYMENTPLGRAEWIRFYGRLFGKAEIADSIFFVVESRYKELCSLTKNIQTKPKLLPEMPWSGQWTLPSSGSYSAKLYQDAGAKYIFADLTGNGSIPLSTEKVLDRGMKADIWLIKHHGTLNRHQINTDTPLLSSIKAPIWWCNTAEMPIFEETPFHPELLLESLIAIIHPNLGIKAQREYFKPLAN